MTTTPTTTPVSGEALPWTPWAGGRRPVADHELVDYRLRNGIEGTNTADALWWHHDGRGDDIVAWRHSPIPTTEPDHARG